MKKSRDEIGKRFKRYESSSNSKLVHRMPVIIRCDGRAFHTFTKHMQKPFDRDFVTNMRFAAIDTAKEMQGFKLAYIQSDEVSFLLTDYDKLTSEGWFNYEINKMVSIAAATMTANFNYYYRPQTGKRPVFDARAFNVPREDVSNYFLWRARDWHRNSIQMYAQSFFSHKELHKKSMADIHGMLHNIGKDWCEDLSDEYKNGSFIRLSEGQVVWFDDILPNYNQISPLVEPAINLDNNGHDTAKATL